MKNIIKKFALSVCAALTLSSCIEETFPTSGATQEQVAESPFALQAMVNSIPTAMILYAQNYAQAWDFGYPAISVSLTHMSGDLVIGGEDGYNWFYFWDQNLGLGDKYVYSGYQFWYNYYAWIKSCNDVISTVAAVPEESWTDEQRHFMGIALTYRALFYLDLVRLIEPKPTTDPDITGYEIPSESLGTACVIVTEATTPEMAKANPRATVEDIYNTVIFPDLARAEVCLADYQRAAKTMPDISVVYGLSARAYLERGYAGQAGAYAKAAEYARKAINCGYTPLTQDQWENPITGFNNYEANKNSWMLCTTQTADQVHNLYSFIAHMSIEESWSVYGHGVGRSINSNLYNEIADDDFRKHSWLDPDFFDFYNYKSCRPDAASFFKATYQGTQNTKEYGAIKFRPGQGDFTTFTIGNAIDFPMMRIEEMYLIEAEAVGAENLEQGKNLLTQFVQTRQPSYTCRSLNLKDFQTEVAKHVRIEFWGEGIPFYYKKRLGLGIHLANSNCKINDARWELDGVAPWWNVCIPITESRSNPAIPEDNLNPDPADTIDPVSE